MTAPSVPPPTPLRAAAAELRAHQDWLGFVQPVGLVVSLPALDKAQCYVNRNAGREQQALRALASATDPPSRIPHFRALALQVLGWEAGDLVEPPESLFLPLPEYGEVLRPTWAVPEAGGGAGFQALVVELPPGMPFDKARTDTEWQASPEARIERLLRETSVTVGLLWNGDALRLVVAPRGESSGHVTFRVAEMCEAAGKPILGGLRALLESDRLFNLPEAQRLPAILRDSRRYQNEVSTALAEQVLDALHALLRGFQAADEAARGLLLHEVVREAPAEVYGGLLATLLRLVFLLYAEDRSLLAVSAVYVRNYAVTALFEKLRDDAARHPDGMDQRFGAWARLLTLFRLVHDGGGHGALRLPARAGRLFDPDAYPFLEGRVHRSRRVQGERLEVPRVSDGVVYRVLDKLLLLRGERLSYRALDVEQIGSVYEAMMGFALEQVEEVSIALRPHHVVVGLASLLKLGDADRLKKLAVEAGCKVTGKAQDGVRAAKTAGELLAALGKLVSARTPEAIPVGTLVLQPTEERRRSGSHYTPRALTEPIVATTLRPIWEAMGPDPLPKAILDLKVCDPAMGSGAFLVAACRALGDKLVGAWQKHGMPKIPLDEDPVLHARRLVAQQCLYGVDKNPFARHIINFGTMSEEEAGRWPALLDVVRRKVKPYRDTVNRESHRKKWWQWGEVRPGLVAALKSKDRVLACSSISKHFAVTWLPTSHIVSHNVTVFAATEDAFFCVIQSRAHELFAAFFSSSLEDRQGYRPTDCFETFPFPRNWQQNPQLEAAGKTYYDHRAVLMIANDEGLTTTYNRFHHPDETAPEILRLRDLHAAMDRAVLDAYGWTDLSPTCAFLLDYEEEEDEDDAARTKKKRKPWRYRWPDDLRDEVLARLLALNAERAAEEKHLGAEAALRRDAAPEAPAKTRTPRKKGKTGGEGQGGLFG